MKYPGLEVKGEMTGARINITDNECLKVFLVKERKRFAVMTIWIKHLILLDLNKKNEFSKM